MGIVIARFIILLAATAAGFALGPALEIRWPKVLWLGAAGTLAGVLAVLLEWQARRIPVERIFWGATGGVLGVLLGLGLGSTLDAVFPGTGPLGRGLFALLLAYLGVTVALAKRDELSDMSAKLFPKTARPESYKILDTSVIIDGRIVDVCQSGFLDGLILVPQFVLRELQQIADSSDALKRNRGKRGFDVLQRLQRLPRVTVRIDELDFPHIREVDRKLIEVAKVTGGRIVTNDYNLNKVAELSGVAVLNVNELANALKPVVLPGEPMHVHVVKEGKEAGQGVAYLDDGTMVVVDHGRRFIGHSVDVTVTTVLQTTAGRMIFARPREEEAPAR
ncbi:MAG TPA: PIN domain-containing protein [Methylomirabilota bacterium]|nr:PIN domain-containing protein [Methylomirabilota bacterium]